jgi:putative FmdB family regulatory protein
MPIYEYECRKCRERFEVLQKASDTDEGLSCPKCEADKPERVLSAFCSVSAKGTSLSSPGHS